jgi:hypothetical protein
LSLCQQVWQQGYPIDQPGGGCIQLVVSSLMSLKTFYICRKETQERTAWKWKAISSFTNEMIQNYRF